MIWSRFLTQQGDLFLNMALNMALEILLVLLASSSVIERGFSTLRRVLRENRLSMKNDRLNQSLIVKCNLPVLRKLINNCDDKIINNAIGLYQVKKKWRWGIRKTRENKEKVYNVYML